MRDNKPTYYIRIDDLLKFALEHRERMKDELLQELKGTFETTSAEKIALDALGLILVCSSPLLFKDFDSDSVGEDELISKYFKDLDTLNREAKDATAD